MEVAVTAIGPSVLRIYYYGLGLALISSYQSYKKFT